MLPTYISKEEALMAANLALKKLYHERAKCKFSLYNVFHLHNRAFELMLKRLIKGAERSKDGEVKVSVYFMQEVYKYCEKE